MPPTLEDYLSLQENDNEDTEISSSNENKESENFM